MNVIVDHQQEKTISRTVESFKVWWETEIASIIKMERLVHYVIINNQIMYDGYEEYIMNNLNTINELNIVTLSRQESIQVTEKTLDEYLDRFLDASMALSKQFYGSVAEETWSDFSDFIQGLDWIIKALEFNIVLFNNEGEAKFYQLTIENLGAVVADMDQSLEQQDHVAVADLIQYEIIPLLQKFRSRHSTEG